MYFVMYTEMVLTFVDDSQKMAQDCRIREQVQETVFWAMTRFSAALSNPGERAYMEVKVLGRRSSRG